MCTRVPACELGPVKSTESQTILGNGTKTVCGESKGDKGGKFEFVQADGTLTAACSFLSSGSSCARCGTQYVVPFTLASANKNVKTLHFFCFCTDKFQIAKHEPFP